VKAAYSGLSHLGENCLNWTPKPVTFLGLVTLSKKELAAKSSVGQVVDDRKNNWFQSVGVHFLCDEPSLWSQFFVLSPFKRTSNAGVFENLKWNRMRWRQTGLHLLAKHEMTLEKIGSVFAGWIIWRNVTYQLFVSTLCCYLHVRSLQPGNYFVTRNLIRVNWVVMLGKSLMPENYFVDPGQRHKVDQGLCTWYLHNNSLVRSGHGTPTVIP
jgi:hypothetical protein